MFMLSYVDTAKIGDELELLFLVGVGVSKL